jgi:iron complex outermembrane receptor protein
MLRWVGVVAVLVMGYLGARAQVSGVVQGQVVDARTGQPLAGATVRLEATVLGAVTGQSGSFLLRGVPPGEYVLRVTMVGYRTVSRSLRVQAGDTLRLSIALEPQPVELGAVVVTAAKREQTLYEAPVSITTVPVQGLQERSFSRLDEVLRTVSGVVINRDQVSIRGSSGFALGVGSRTLVLVEGIPLLSGDGGEIKYDALPLFALERVEVLKGAASALYGTAALGGVVNIVTAEPPEEGQYRWRVYGGLYGRPRFPEWDIGRRGLWGADLSYARQFGAVGLLLSCGGVRDESYRRDADSRRWNLLGKVRWTLSSSTRLTLLGQHAADDRGNWVYWASLRRATEPGNGDSFQRVRSFKSMLALQWQQLWSKAVTSTARVGLYRTDFANWQQGGGADTLPRSEAFSLTAEWQWGWQLRPQLLLTAGAQAVENLVDATLYGHRRQFIGSFYGQLELGTARSVGLTAGLRLDWEHTGGAQRNPVELSPRLGLTYASWFGPRLRATVGRAFRAPTVAERFATTQAAGFTVRANPELQPERGWSGEIGAMDTLWLPVGRWRIPMFVDAALFQSDFFGFIEPQFRTVGDTMVAVQFVNLTRARVQGAELLLRTWLGPSREWAPQGLVGIEGGLTLLEPRDLSRGDWLRYRSRRIGILRARLPLPWVELQLEYRYQSRVERVDEEFVNLGLIRNADARVPIHVVDAWVTVPLQRLGIPMALTVNVRNVLDYYYTEVPGNLAPPRQFGVQLSGQW